MIVTYKRAGHRYNAQPDAKLSILGWAVLSSMIIDHADEIELPLVAWERCTARFPCFTCAASLRRRPVHT